MIKALNLLKLPLPPSRHPLNLQLVEVAKNTTRGRLRRLPSQCLQRLLEAAAQPPPLFFPPPPLLFPPQPRDPSSHPPCPRRPCMPRITRLSQPKLHCRILTTTNPPPTKSIRQALSCRVTPLHALGRPPPRQFAGAFWCVRVVPVVLLLHAAKAFYNIKS